MAVLTGWTVVATLLLFLLSLAGWVPKAVPTVVVWSALLMLWPSLSRSARKQSLLLLGFGALALGFAAWHGVMMGWAEMFAVNLPLLAMFVAVSFLSLAAVADENRSLPTGAKALVQSGLGMHLLGAVINLSVLFIFGDRLQRNGRLTAPQQVLLARTFCAAAWWSPFFVATGVALTYAPGMHWQSTFPPGMLMAAMALAFTMLDLRYRFSNEVFEGYPLRLESLVMPVTLAAAVMLIHFYNSQVSVLALICILSPLGAMLFMQDRPRVPAVVGFIQNKLANIGNQFALFLAAGLFSSGIKAILLVYPTLIQLGEDALTAPMYMLISGIMILVGMVGVHPVVSIAIVSPILLPLGTDPNKLGFLFVTTWAVSTASSPLSGFGLAMVSRYQASPSGILRNNWYYALLMWLMSGLISYLWF